MDDTRGADTSRTAADRLAGDDPRDLVVLLDAHGQPCGTAPRATVHGTDTPLHLAFSCYLFDDDGRLLLTRRALSKRSWPGVWTNSFCGHPRPDESVEEAIHRHGRGELGLDVEEVRPVLPDFRYRATDAAGVVENEICPVYAARAVSAPRPHPDEVAEHRWVELDDLRTVLAVAPWALSPWLCEQAAALDAAEAWHDLSPGRSTARTGTAP